MKATLTLLKRNPLVFFNTHYLAYSQFIAFRRNFSSNPYVATEGDRIKFEEIKKRQ